MPLMYYKQNEPIGRIVKEEDFSQEIAENIILFCSRLHEMGVFSEDKIVRFTIQGMIDMLSKLNVINDITIKSFNLAQVAFGNNYAGYWYEDKESDPPSLYMVPEQIAFYHSEKEDNYYLSLIEGGIDLCKNKVSDSDREKVSDKIGKGTLAGLGIIGMIELKNAFKILFIYLKYKIIISADKLGYNSFIQAFSNDFCKEEQRQKFVDYAKQYFLLNTEKKDIYWCAHEQIDFAEFFHRVTLIFNVGIQAGRNSFDSYSDWFEENCGIRLKKRDFENSFELLSNVNDALKRTGKSIYILDFDDYFDNTILVGNEFADVRNDFGIEIEKFEDTLKDRYSESIEYETRIRRVSREFYASIGVKNVDHLMRCIYGTDVLDQEVYDRDYIVNLDWKEDVISELVYDFFSKHGLETLIEDLCVDGKTIDERHFGDCDEVSPYDRMILYADEIKKRGKLLAFLDTESDSFHFVIIENDNGAKERFINAANKLIEIGEICAFTIFE